MNLISSRPLAVAALVCLASYASFASSASAVQCATSESAETPEIAITAEELEAARGTNRLGSFQITLVAGAGLSGNAPALAAFQRAVDQWEAYFSDPITIRIDANMADLGSPSIIGSTGSVNVSSPYTQVRDAMVNDASDESDDDIVAFLPTLAQASFTYPDSFTSTGSLRTSKANLKALGYAGLDAIHGASDGTILFNTTFPFDYDNSDGVTAGTFDFETVAAHEIGHLLGFFSAVDTMDSAKHSGTTSGNVSPSVMDLFRFRFTSPNPATNANFTSFARSLTYNTNDIADDLIAERRMSTGTYLGDGNQASHWKENTLTGTMIGLMDPQLNVQEVQPVYASDVRALDLMGYDFDLCGNGTVGAGEQCDDSNHTNGDCCNSECQYESSGSPCADDGSSCTNDQCSLGMCTHPTKSNGTSCNDNVFCNGADVCFGGNCLHIGNPCTAGTTCNNSCNEAADNCFNIGTGCSSDGNSCTNDVCAAGACTHPGNTLACDDGLFCNGSDTCSGGTCSQHTGDPCSGGSECNDACNETTDGCQSNGSACEDGVFCNGADSCIAGACTQHAGDPCLGGPDCNTTCNESPGDCSSPASTPCSSDSDVCTSDECDGSGTCAHAYDGSLDPGCAACPPLPDSGCLASTAVGFSAGDSTDDTKDKMSWKWSKGEASAETLFGTPVTSTAYRFCVYAHSAGSFTLLSSTGVLPSTAWTDKGTKLTYKDKLGASGGLTLLKIVAGDSPSIKLKYKGMSTELPGPFDGTNFVEPGTDVVAQLVNNEGNCWGMAFRAAEMKLNEVDKAKLTASYTDCGDGMAEFGEACDGIDDEACPGFCDVACTCAP